MNERGPAVSMIGNFMTASDETIRRTLADPSSITDQLYPDNLDGPGGGEGVAAIDVDKAWHGIHYLLSGSAWEGDWPLGFILTGGTTVGDVDVGYGPARALTSDEVATIAGALAKIGPADLRARFDADALADQDVYPSIWDEGDTAADYLVEHYESLRTHFAMAAARKLGMYLWLS